MERSRGPLTHGLLDKLTAADRARLTALGRERGAEPGEVLVRQGSVGDCLFIVEAGEVEVVRALPGDEERILLTAGPGTVLGEVAVLDGGARAASLRAKSGAVLRVIRLGAFEALVLHGGEAGHRILRAIAESVHQRLQATRCVSARCGDATCALPAGAPLRWIEAPRALAGVLPVLRPFARLHELDLKALVQQLQVTEVPRGADVILPEPSGAGAVLVLRGALSPWLDDASGPEVTMPAVAPGGFVDYATALGFEARSRRWRARSPTALVRIGAAAFAPEAEHAAELLYALSRDLATALRRATGLAMHFGMAWTQPAPEAIPASAGDPGVRLAASPQEA